MDTIPEITIASLIDRYDVLLLDAYGVLVNSSGALPGAAELTHRLSESGKPYYILTNDASRLPTTAAAQYRACGLTIDPDRIITSGLLLKGHFAAQRLVGARCAVLGPGDSLRYVEDAGGRIVSPSDAFDVLVIADESGFPFLETVDATLSALFHALDRRQRVHLLRSEEHTSELQSLAYLVCRLLLEKKKKKNNTKDNSDTQKHTVA